MRRAGTLLSRPNAVGFASHDPVPLPSLNDAGLAGILARAPSDPRVDIVVMHRHKCHHCKPELNRVADAVKRLPDVFGHAVEIDEDRDIGRLRDLLLDDNWSSPSTGYFRGGKLVLSSPSRAVTVDEWVKVARGEKALADVVVPAPARRQPLLGGDRIS